jgi:hypothetical protein
VGFFYPVWKGGVPEEPDSLKVAVRQLNAWPMTEFRYPADKPGIGDGVDYPQGTC